MSTGEVGATVTARLIVRNDGDLHWPETSNVQCVCGEDMGLGIYNISFFGEARWTVVCRVVVEVSKAARTLEITRAELGPP